MMVEDPTRPTLEERYARAIDVTDMTVSLEHRTPVDLLIGAGWTRETLGTALYRLKTEFDAVRGDLRLAGNGITLTDFLLILSGLQTLRGTRDALGRFSIAYATRRKYMVPDDTVVKIAGKALQYWLDPQCHACSGRGFNGGFGLPLELCKACHGTKRREATFHHTAAGHEFARALLCEMDRKTEHVNTMLKKFLASGTAPAKREWIGKRLTREAK